MRSPSGGLYSIRGRLTTHRGSNRLIGHPPVMAGSPVETNKGNIIESLWGGH